MHARHPESVSLSVHARVPVSAEGRMASVAPERTAGSPVGGASPKNAMRNLFKDADGPDEQKQNHRFPIRSRLMYTLDRGFESNSFQAFMIVMTLLLGIVFGAILIYLGDAYVEPDDVLSWDYGTNASFGEAVWKSWTYMADPGTHADVDTNSYYRFAAFTTTMLGILLMAAIIGFVVDAIKKKMDALDTGRSRVLEKGHILVLGWTEKTVQVIDQLALMMESEGGGKIVLCSDKPKRDALDEVSEHCTLKNSSIIVRTGSIASQSDLSKLSAPFARAIIILAPEGAADKADASVLRCVLSLKGLPHKLQGHVIAEMRDIDNTSLVEVVGGSSVETIVSHDVVGRLMIQAARQHGLADVYGALLGFEGDEIYLQKWPSLIGKTFGEVLRSFADAIPIGVATRNSSGAMHVQLNPPDNRVVGLSEAIVVIAEDDDSYFPSDTPEMTNNSLAMPVDDQGNKKSEKVLMTGWRRDIDDIIVLLDELVSPGSELHMLNELDIDERNDRLIDGGLDPETGLVNLSIVHHIGNPAVRRKLDEVEVSKFDSVLILSDEAFEEDMMHSDSHSLAILLLIRDLQLQANAKKLKQASLLVPGLNKFSAMAKAASPTLSKILPSKLVAIRSPGSAKEVGPAQDSNMIGAKQSTGLLEPVSTQNSAGISKPTLMKAATFLKKNTEDVKKKQKMIPNNSCIVTCEILDPTTHTMIMQNPAIAHMSDYVLSNNTVSKVLAMVAESREVKTVLKELLGSSGCDIAVSPIKKYTHSGMGVSFWDLFGQVRQKGEILIGYMRDDDALYLNPKSEARHIPLNWNLEKDRLVIITSTAAKAGMTSRTRSSQ